MTGPAEQSECSRATVYQHAREVEHRLASAAGTESSLAGLRAARQRPRRRIAVLERAANDLIGCDRARQRPPATTAFAMGCSRRPLEGLLGVPSPAADVPDHSTPGPWVRAEAERAGAVRAALGPACAPRVQTRARDEPWSGGDRPGSGSSRRA